MSGYAEVQRLAARSAKSQDDRVRSATGKPSARRTSEQPLQLLSAMDASAHVREQAALQRALDTTAQAPKKNKSVAQSVPLQLKGTAVTEEPALQREPIALGSRAGPLQLANGSGKKKVSDPVKAALHATIKKQRGTITEQKPIINKAIVGGKLKAGLNRDELRILIDALEKSIKAREAETVAYNALGIKDPKNHEGRTKLEKAILTAAKNAKQALQPAAAPAGAAPAAQQPADTKSMAFSNPFDVLEDEGNLGDDKE